MAVSTQVSIAPSIEARRAALAAVRKSNTFSRNPRLSALLDYVCFRSFSQKGASIKEFDIATDVFGRAPDFDQSTDAIVRVEMYRLRKKLKEFYDQEGRNEPIEIVIQTGQYLPDFVPRHVTTETLPLPDETLPRELPPPRRVQGFVIWIAIAAVIATLATVAVLWRKSNREAVRLPEAHETATIPPLAGAASEGIRILCGSSKAGYRDRDGFLWGADAFYSGGAARQSPEAPVYRTRDPFLFRSARSGEFSYNIPLERGIYELHLFFSDPTYTPGIGMEGGEGLRVFQISLNGQPLVRDFDIIAEAGANTADVRVFKDVYPAKDGYLHLSFVRQQGAPLVNAIEVVPGNLHRLRPIRIVTQDAPVVDRAGTTWYPDNYFVGGRAITHASTIAGPEDPQLYARERYGNFSYAIPVSPGKYRVSMRFAEGYWGANSPGGGGIGTRVFDVYCNGIALLRNFDILQEAGPQRQVVKTFHNLQPNAQGTLLLSFVPVRNYANVSAIEVVDESEN